MLREHLALPGCSILRRASPGVRPELLPHIEITRIFDAPRELVYRAFVEPDQPAQWGWPAGCSVPRDSIEIDARVGGHLRFVMTAPDVRSPVDATFTEVVERTAGGRDGGRRRARRGRATARAPEARVPRSHTAGARKG